MKESGVRIVLNTISIIGNSVASLTDSMTIQKRHAPDERSLFGEVA